MEPNEKQKQKEANQNICSIKCSTWANELPHAVKGQNP